MFLARLAYEFGGKDVGNIVVCTVNGNRIEAAKCNHEKGCWELTPAGEKLLASRPAPIVEVEEEAPVQPHVAAARAKKIASKNMQGLGDL